MKLDSLVRDLRSLFALASIAIVASTGCAAGAGTNDGNDGSDEHTATTQQAITNGDDDDDDMAVVGLMLQGQLYCTGVLVTKNVVLTAARCVHPTPPDQIYFGANPKTKKGGTFIGVSDTKAHPEFDEDTLVNDIAMVGLETKATVAPMPVHTEELDASFKGMAIRLVGFGVEKGGTTTGTRKRTGDSSIQTFGDNEFRFKGAPSQTCNGDSGGPAFATINGKETVIGITSSGDADCKVYGRDIAVGAFLPFLQSYTKAYALRANAAPQESAGCSMTTRAPAPGSYAGALLLGLAFAAATARRRAR